MTRSSNKVFSKLNNKLKKLDSNKHELCLLTKDSYFTRESKKLSFIDDIKIILSMGQQSIKKEMYKYFGHDCNVVSVPGFIESRSKIKEDAFKILMDEINKYYLCNKTYKGYRLLAVDGSDITISFDGDDFDTYKNNGEGIRPNSAFHLNALYDILNHRYLDAVIQGCKTKNEIRAMIEMCENYNGEKGIFIADRGYNSFNLFEHIRNIGGYFLIRIKDLGGKTSIINRFKLLPKEGTFDMIVNITFTNLQTKEIKYQPNKYITLMNNQKFDFINKENRFYETLYRFVRIKIDGVNETHETLITNLPQAEFASEDIEKLYKLRWGIEVSYRHLKYSISLNALHSKRRDFIKQEIWARMIMFNISMIIIDEASKTKIKKNERKYEYQINISMAIHLVMSFIKKKGGAPPNLLELIAKEILPIRPDRSFERKVKGHSFVSFGYRFN